MDLALRDFKRTLPDNDVALFFFAGHGMHIEGESYLAAIDLAHTHTINVMPRAAKTKAPSTELTITVR